MQNLTIIESTNYDDIITRISRIALDGANFTNGTYVTQPNLPLDKILSTLIAGFRFITNDFETHCYHPMPIVVMLNSDLSLQKLGKKDYDGRNQIQRAYDVGECLAQNFPHHEIIIGFFDEETPTALYKLLEEQSLTRTHHKWGYGTNPEQPIIEGADFFDKCFGFPMPDDTKAICHELTAMPNPEQPQPVIVRDLRGKYIDRERNLLPNLHDHHSEHRRETRCR